MTERHARPAFTLYITELFGISALLVRTGIVCSLICNLRNELLCIKVLVGRYEAEAGGQLKEGRGRPTKRRKGGGQLR